MLPPLILDKVRINIAVYVPNTSVCLQCFRTAKYTNYYTFVSCHFTIFIVISVIQFRDTRVMTHFRIEMFVPNFGMIINIRIVAGDTSNDIHSPPRQHANVGPTLNNGCPFRWPKVDIQRWPNVSLLEYAGMVTFIRSQYAPMNALTLSKPRHIPASILYKSTAGRYRPASHPDGPITARYRFM